MIEHVVFFAVRPDTPESSVDAMVAALRKLPEAIPEVRSLTIGPTFTDRGREFTHGLHVRFADRDALATYLAHSAHVAAVEEVVKPIAADVVVLDWES